MSSVFHLIKLAVAVTAGVSACVCLFVAQGLVVPLGVVSIAFSVMPE